MITDPARLLPAAPTRFLLKAQYIPNIECAGHLRRCLDPATRRETVKQVIRILAHFDFDAIAFRGLSGSLIAPTVAMEMDKTLLAVRKGEHCHSGRTVEGDINALRYVIVDDMISSGDTVVAILEDVAQSLPRAKCIGVLQYLWLGMRSRHTDVMISIRQLGYDYGSIHAAARRIGVTE